MSDSSSSRSVIGSRCAIRNLDADRRLARDAIDQHRLGLHRETEIVGQAGDAAVLHAGVGLELVGRDDRAGMDLDDGALDGELAALLFEQPRGVHQLALVDLALVLRRVEQRDRRQRCSRPCAARPASSPASASASGSGCGDRRWRARSNRRAAWPARPRGAPRPRRRRPRRHRVGARLRARGLERRGGVGGLGRDLRRRVRAGLLDVLLDDLLAARVLAAPLLAPLAPAREQAALAAHAAADGGRTPAPNENCVDEDDREREQRQQQDRGAGAIEECATERRQRRRRCTPPGAERDARSASNALDGEREQARRRTRRSRHGADELRVAGVRPCGTRSSASRRSRGRPAAGRPRSRAAGTTPAATNAPTRPAKFVRLRRRRRR